MTVTKATSTILAVIMILLITEATAEEKIEQKIDARLVERHGGRRPNSR
jgi:hypothetical protein